MRRATHTKRSDDEMAAGFDRRHDGFYILFTVFGSSEKVKDGAVVPHVVLLASQVYLRNIGFQPGDGLSPRAEPPLGR